MIDFISFLGVCFVVLVGLSKFVERYYLNPHQAQVRIGLGKALAELKELRRGGLFLFAHGRRPWH